MADGGASLDLRIRHEQVEDPRFALNATAETVRLHGAAVSPRRAGAYLGVAVDVIRHVGAPRYFDSVNAQRQYPEVFDPDAEELDEAYAGLDTTALNWPLTLWAGRKAFSQSNKRFLSGGLAWRQNPQSLDGARLATRAGSVEAEMAYLTQALRPAGNRSVLGRQGLNAPVLGLHWAATPGLDLELYAHRLRYRAGGPIAPSSSTEAVFSTVRFATQRGDWSLRTRLDFARQWALTADGDAQGRYGAAEAGVRHRGTELRLGLEALGGDGTQSFQTPLAALHFFNGTADRFLRTPPDGLWDRWVGISQAWGLLTVSADLHRFDAVHAAYRYGQEADLAASLTLPHQQRLLLKAAVYEADHRQPLAAVAPPSAFDVTKVWLQWEWQWASH